MNSIVSMYIFNSKMLFMSLPIQLSDMFHMDPPGNSKLIRGDSRGGKRSKKLDDFQIVQSGEHRHTNQPPLGGSARRATTNTAKNASG